MNNLSRPVFYEILCEVCKKSVLDFFSHLFQLANQMWMYLLGF